MTARESIATLEELLSHDLWARALARSLVSDASLADDIVQQTWVQALERPPPHRRNLKGWFATALRRRVIDHHRGERRRAAREDKVRREDAAPAEHELLEQAETRARLAQAVMELEEPQRSTLLLRYFENVTPERIASLQSVAVSTVHTRTQRGLAQLRERLRRDYGSDASWLQALMPLAGLHPSTTSTLTTGSLLMSAATTRLTLTLGILLLFAVAVFFGAKLFLDSTAPSGEEARLERAGEGEAPLDPEASAPRLEGLHLPPAAGPAAPRPSGHVLEGAEARPGTVEGRVQDERARPLARADVILWDAGGRRVVRRTASDVEGRFQFEDLDAGAYTVSVHGPGGAGVSHEARPGGRSLVVTLEVAGAQPVRPSDRVTEGADVAAGVVEGSVFDDTGRPLEGALVMIIDGARVLARVDTDDAGVFRFESLEGARLVLSVHAPGWAALQHPVAPGESSLQVRMERGPSLGGIVVDADSDQPIAGLPITVLSTAGGVAVVRAETAEDGTFLIGGVSPDKSFLDLGQRTGHRQGAGAEYVVMRAGPFESGALDLRIEVSRGLVIAGEVRGPDGAPREGKAWVDVAPITAQGHVDHGGRRFGTVQKDGTFRVPGLPAGYYDVTVHPTTREEAWTDDALTRVPRIAAGTVDLIVELRPGESIELRLVDETGEPVTVVGYVWVSPSGTPIGEPGSATAASLGEGRYRSVPLDPGRAYDIRALGFRGYQEGRLQGVHPGDTDLSVVLPKGAVLEGRVRLSSGTPGPIGVPVVASATGEWKDHVGKEPWAYVRVRTGPNGAFVLAGLREGVTYKLEAGGGDSGLVPHGAKRIVAAPAKDVTLEVMKGARLSGRLVDGEGRPVAGVVLHARPTKGGRGAWTRTESDGSFAFAGLAPGRATLGATIDGKYVNLGEFEAPASGIQVRSDP